MPPDRLADVAERLGLAVAQANDIAAVAVSPRAEPRLVRQALDRGARAFVQLTPDGGVPPHAGILDRLPGSGGHANSLVLWLTTGAAFALDCAVVVGDWLVNHDILSSARRPEVELAIHEAISNAIIHGNLGIGVGVGDAPDGFDRFYAAVIERLEQPEVAARRIGVEVGWNSSFITVAISDQGTGFDPDRTPLARTDAKSGRGLQIIRQIAQDVRFLEGGCRIVLSFGR